jgi:hypothetical protein
MANALVLALMSHANAASCDDAWPHRVQRDGVTIVFATQPATVKIGHHFSVQGVVCPAVTTLRVDADMPAHRHGMNYRASTELQADGRFNSRGLLFHMPGRWRFIFDLQVAQQPLRLSLEHSVE